jgi:hypothetical protein
MRIARMISIIMPLAEGDRSLPTNFAAAVTVWRGFHERSAGLGEAELAQAVSNAQWEHEGFFDGDRHLGKMSMPLAALAALYDEGTGFEDNRSYAVRLLRAFSRSSVSIEIKGSALTDAIVAFDLEEEPTLREIVKDRFRW